MKLLYLISINAARNTNDPTNRCFSAVEMESRLFCLALLLFCLLFTCFTVTKGIGDELAYTICLTWYWRRATKQPRYICWVYSVHCTVLKIYLENIQNVIQTEPKKDENNSSIWCDLQKIGWLWNGDISFMTNYKTYYIHAKLFRSAK